MDEAEHVGLVSVSLGGLSGLVVLYTVESKRGGQCMSWYDVEARRSRDVDTMNAVFGVSDGGSRTQRR